ncbi:MAG: protein-disulfide reductase DsbD domain-containing protein [Bacteroidota bacterium]
MKKISLILLLACGSFVAKAQIEKDPAHWAYGLKKLAGNVYEVHLQCTIDDPWHIYAQKQTKDFIGTATKITFAKQPGLALKGIPAEIGKKDTYKDETVGILNYEFAGKVDFVQKVTIKPGLKEVRGMILYQTCTHEHCLTAQTIQFHVPVPE